MLVLLYISAFTHDSFAPADSLFAFLIFLHHPHCHLAITEKASTWEEAFCEKAGFAACLEDIQSKTHNQQLLL